MLNYENIKADWGATLAFIAHCSSICCTEQTELPTPVDQQFRSRLLGTLLVMVTLHCGLTMSYMGLLPGLTGETLQSSGGYGSIVTAIGVGAMVGSLSLLSVTGRRARGALYLMTALLSGITLSALAFSQMLPTALKR